MSTMNPPKRTVFALVLLLGLAGGAAAAAADLYDAAVAHPVAVRLI